MRDRFFVAGAHAPGDAVTFADDDAHKIATVLRKRSGDRVTIVDSAGAAFAATLAIEGRRATAVLDERLERGAIESTARIVIAQAIPKGQKMDLIVEKATELGAAAMVPLHSLRVIGEGSRDNKVERWQRIAKSAAQQSGRLVVPHVAAVHSWEQLLATFPEYDRVYIPWELADPQPLRTRFEAEVPSLRSALVIIGPEGGFAEDEVQRAVDAGAIAISLGTRILRTETAALVVIAAWMYARGEL